LSRKQQPDLLLLQACGGRDSNSYTTIMTTSPRAALAIRHSIAPRVLDNTVPMSTLTSTQRFSVRVAPAAPESNNAGAGEGDADDPVLATFIWKDPGARVQLAGSFDDWRKHDMTYVPGVGYFVLVVEVPPGRYFYRFVVDGRWRIAEEDDNLQEDDFGELSHYLVISQESLKSATPNRFSTAALSRAKLARVSVTVPGKKNYVDFSTTRNNATAGVTPISGVATDHTIATDDSYDENGESSFQSIQAPLPRHRGDEFINDYDDDPCGEYDLQADIFEAMADVKEAVSQDMSKSLLLPPVRAQEQAARAAAARRKQPRRNLLANAFGRLFGKDFASQLKEGAPNDDAPENNDRMGTDRDDTDSSPKSKGRWNQNRHGTPSPPRQGGYTGLTQVTDDGSPDGKSGKLSRIRVWFPNELSFPVLRGGGRKMKPEEIEAVQDGSSTALRVNLAEENAANRQMLGKSLFTQGKYDAALALFSLSVKIREDNGLRNAKTTAVAHTDVASAFIHLEDLKNAEKHLNSALAIHEKKAFAGGKPELGDVHCFMGVVADMRGSLDRAATCYRTALSLYDESGSVKGNPNYSTARQNLKDNLRRQKLAKEPGSNTMSRSPSRIDRIGASLAGYGRGEVVDRENVSSTTNVSPPLKKSPQKKSPGAKGGKEKLGKVFGGQMGALFNKPQTISSTGTFPTSEPSMTNSQLLDPETLMGACDSSPSSARLSPVHDAYRQNGEHDKTSSPLGPNKFERPTTWKALADIARASMPKAPVLKDEEEEAEDADTTPLGTYEEMSRGWQRDGRTFLVEGKYSEAIDMYTLAIYTRKRHGPWATKANAETHVEYARALFANKDMATACSALRDAISIIEKISDAKLDRMLGDVWGNLGCALDRLGGNSLDAESAHCAGLVAYGRAGLSKDDPTWTKAWRNLCVSVKAQGSKAKPIDKLWESIDQQVRGIVPMTQVASVKIHV
jgi:tetratricopeptide (TPR) repeat protein